MGLTLFRDLPFQETYSVTQEYVSIQNTCPRVVALYQLLTVNTFYQQNGVVDKKDDSGNETVAEPEQEDDSHEVGYDKTKSFFDNISCEAVERQKGKTPRTDWRQERKLNTETFGVGSNRRGK